MKHCIEHGFQMLDENQYLVPEGASTTILRLEGFFQEVRTLIYNTKNLPHIKVELIRRALGALAKA